MNILQKIKSLFKKKSQTDEQTPSAQSSDQGGLSQRTSEKYNVLIVRSKEQPSYKHQGDKTRIVTLPDYKYPGLNGIELFPEGAIFYKISTKVSKKNLWGSGDYWAILTKKNQKGEEIGTLIFYPTRENNEYKWKCWNNPKLATQILEEIAFKIMGGDNADEQTPSTPEVAPEEVSKTTPEVENPSESEYNIENTAEENSPEVEAQPQSTAEAEAEPEPEANQDAELIAEIEKLKKEKLNLYNELLQMAAIQVGKDADVSEVLRALKAKIKDLQDTAGMVPEYERENKRLADIKNNLETKSQELEKKNNSLKASIDQLEKGKSAAEQAKADLNKKLEDSQKENAGRIARLNTEKEELNSTLEAEKAAAAELQKKLEEEIGMLRATEAGQLQTKVEELTASLKETNESLTAARQESADKQTTIEAKEEKIKALCDKRDELSHKFTEKNNECNRLNSSLEKANSTIDKQTKQIEDLNSTKDSLEKTLADTKDTLSLTEDELKDANKEIGQLKAAVANRDGEIANLNTSIATLTGEKTALEATIDGDIRKLEECYSEAAESLKRSVEKDFLSECDPEAETGTVESMCGKIRRGVGVIADSINGLKEKKFESAKALQEAYEELITENIEGHAFTEIARWWAYSRLPFILNRDREEGRTVSISDIDKAYAALCRLLDLAGYRYQIPALFAENLEEGDYENLTGKEQLNLDYQYPNVRSHIEAIDRDDKNNPVIDIVQLGYYKGDQLASRTSVIV